MCKYLYPRRSSRACVVLEKEEEKERTLQVPPESRISQQQLHAGSKKVVLSLCSYRKGLATEGEGIGENTRREGG